MLTLPQNAQKTPFQGLQINKLKYFQERMPQDPPTGDCLLGSGYTGVCNLDLFYKILYPPQCSVH